MRLSESQRAIVREEVARAFGEGASVRLFGSPVEDDARSGDIHLQTEAYAETRRKAAMQINRIQLTLVALALVIPFTAVAASDDKPTFGEADIDGDGVVTIEEAVEAGIPKKEAKRTDLEGDGELTESDWSFVEMNSAE